MRSLQQADQFSYLCNQLSFASDVAEPVIKPDAHDGYDNWCQAVSLALLPGLLPALCHRRLSTYARPPQAIPCASTSFTEQQVRHFWAEHDYRCDRQRACLVEAACALNGVGIVPMLMTGARAIWIRDPAWQFVHRIGLVVQPRAWKQASEALRKIGFRNVRRLDPSGFKRELHFFRPDLNGVLALRDAGSPPLQIKSMGEDDVFSCVRTFSIDGTQVLLQPAHLRIACDMLHRHFRRPGFGSCVITLKELYEFSWAVAALDEDECDALQALALERPNIATVLTAWADEANRMFGLTIPWPSDAHRNFSSTRKPVIKTVLIEPDPWLGPIPLVSPLLYKIGLAASGVMGGNWYADGARSDPSGSVQDWPANTGHRGDGTSVKTDRIKSQ